MDIFEEALQAHKKLKGKISVTPKVDLQTKKDLSLYYSPGVGAVSSLLAEHPEQAREYTALNNTVAVISDGTSVLGLGNIGPIGALPVMEGKAILFKKFGGIDAFPIVLNTQEPNEIIETIVNIAPSFGGINLEDFASPNCFYIESELIKQLDMPIMHDDQHGTAIVVLAGLINACKVVDKNLADCKVVICGTGAAGIAVAKLLHEFANPEITAVDSVGIINKNRINLNTEKKMILEFTSGPDGYLDDAINGADIFIGVSRAGLLKSEMVRKMAKDPIIFALANPVPEIMPEVAKEAGAKVIATGRSDYPNQVNNVLAFPGIFRGALDTQSLITSDIKIAVSIAIAGIIETPTADYIIPSPLDPTVAKAVAKVFYN